MLQKEQFLLLLEQFIKNLIQNILVDNKKHYKQSIDCSIMTLADDIAYGVHDLEDALYLDIIHRDLLETKEWTYIIKECNFIKFYPNITDNLFSSHDNIRKKAIGYLVHFLICSTYIEKNLHEFDNAIFQYTAKLSKQAETLINFLHKFIFDNVILNTETNKLEKTAHNKITQTFLKLQNQGMELRSIADKISSMSDNEICLKKNIFLS